MSLKDAKRLLQWNVVMEALSAAEVDAETVAMVEQARHVSDVAHSLTTVLLGTADAKQTKNYVKVEMVGLIAPFERAYVELVRPGGKTSHELREMLRDRLKNLREWFAARGVEDVVQGIDETLAAEAP